MKTLLSVKTDPVVKEQAKKLADELGLTLSALVTAQLKQAIRAQSVFFTATNCNFSPHLEKILAKVERDIQTGKNLPPAITNTKELNEYFNVL